MKCCFIKWFNSTNAIFMRSISPLEYQRRACRQPRGHLGSNRMSILPSLDLCTPSSHGLASMPEQCTTSGYFVVILFCQKKFPYSGRPRAFGRPSIVKRSKLSSDSSHTGNHIPPTQRNVTPPIRPTYLSALFKNSTSV